MTGLSNNHFNTFGIYTDEVRRKQDMENECDGSDYNYEYYDGLNCEEWIEKLKTNDINGLYTSLKTHGLDKTINYKILYHKINTLDWRQNSCGGCCW